jgi:hypothetical protein
VNFFKKIFLLGLLILSFSVQAQYHEVGFESGSTSYFGDLNSNSLVLKYQPVGGAFYRKNFTPHFAWRTNLNICRFSFQAAKSNNKYIQYQNLNFRNTLAEGVTMLEFNFFKYKSNLVKDATWSPFIFWGAGFAYYFTQANYDGKWEELVGLKTEGKDYIPLTFVMPLGGGLKFNIAKSVTLSIECMYHHTYTDYLDDVSNLYIQKKVQTNKKSSNFADPSNTTNPLSDVVGKQRGDQFKDKYMFTMISLSYTFFTPHCPNPDSEDSFDK